MNPVPAPGDPLVISYLKLRKAVGVIGIALPFVLAFGGMALLEKPAIESSVSHYYHTGMRDVFVGSLCAIGVFLFSYRGYDRRDNRAGNLACAFAIGVALVPTTPESGASPRDRFAGAMHLFFAAGFFLTLAYFSLVLFRKSDPARPPTSAKRKRNRVYAVCGYTMLACVGLIAAAKLLLSAARVDALDLVFWFEAAAVLAFGVSWLTKGEAILKDGDA